MNKFLLTVMLFMATITSAHAWGPREQGALAGIAATLLWQHVQGASQPQQPPVTVGSYPQQQPQVIYAPQPQVIYAPQPQIIYVPQRNQPQIIVIPQPQHSRNGYWVRPDSRVYNPQQW